MAESPAHRFGQLIGELLEAVVLPQLEAFCKKQGLYLDHQKKARPARTGKKVTWEDQYGNVVEDQLYSPPRGQIYSPLFPC